MIASKYPFTWKENDCEDQEKRGKFWTKPGAISVKQMISDPMSVNMPMSFVKEGMNMKVWNIEPRSDDLWIVTYPKSGTTMASELLWQMSTGCDVKSEKSKQKLTVRCPFLEYTTLASNNAVKQISPTFEDEHQKREWDEFVDFKKDSIGYVENAQSPRMIKTHLPISMLPPNLLDVSKVVVVARNVMDVCVSFFHMDKMTMGLGLPDETCFDDFVDFFISGKPSVYGNYWNHLKDALSFKHHPNLKIVWYEDLTTNFERQVMELSEFTGYKMTDENMKILKEHMKIDNFRENDAVNNRPPPGVATEEVRQNCRFIRKGGVGGWKEYFSNENTLKKMNEWIKENNFDEFGKEIEGLRFE